MVALLQYYDIEYVSQKARKGQVLANFVAAYPVPKISHFTTDLLDEEVMLITIQKRWKMFCSGGLFCPRQLASYDRPPSGKKKSC